MFALRRDSSKARFCVVGIFYFVNSRKGPFAGWNVSWRDYRFVAQNSRISHFQCGHLPKHSSVNSALHGTSSRITDWGLVLGLSNSKRNSLRISYREQRDGESITSLLIPKIRISRREHQVQLIFLGW